MKDEVPHCAHPSFRGFLQEILCSDTIHPFFLAMFKAKQEKQQAKKTLTYNRLASGGFWFQAQNEKKIFSFE